MDALAGLLEGPRARGAFMIRACVDPPWCSRVEDRAPLTIMRGDPAGRCACTYRDGRSLQSHWDLGVRSRGDRLEGSTVPLIGTYLMQGEVGGRLLVLLMIAALCAWFSRPEAEAPAWYRARADPAANAGVARAAPARRFSDLVGEPAMTYLTGRRLALAADRLRETDDTLDAIARRVGYGSALKRVYGVSPAGAPDAGGVT